MTTLVKSSGRVRFQYVNCTKKAKRVDVVRILAISVPYNVTRLISPFFFPGG